MTRIYLGRDEWWPVTDPQPVNDDDPDGYEIDQNLIAGYNEAVATFQRAARVIARAAADAGDKYWQDDT